MVLFISVDSKGFQSEPTIAKSVGYTLLKEDSYFFSRKKKQPVFIMP